MAIEGDLKDIGLGNIVQLLCLERRKGRLQLRQGEDGGTIFFQEGEIVHATSGELTGTEAVYKLLTWDWGWFRMTDQATPFRNTINLNWKNLLLNGMRRIDEKARFQQEPPAPKPPSAAAVTHDRHLECDLIAWFSQAEQVLHQLQLKKNMKRPLFAVQALADLLNDAVGFNETHLQGSAQMMPLSKALADALEDFPQTRILYATKNRISVKTVLNMYKNWGDDPADRLYFMRQVVRGMIFTLELYLSNIVAQFHRESKRTEWRQPQEVFLVDLRRLIDQIPF